MHRTQVHRDKRMKAAAGAKKRGDSLWKAVGLGFGDGARVAENHKDFLYGK